MAQLGKYRIPAEYKDEDKWWKFTKRQIVYIAIALAIDWLMYKIFQPMGLTVVWLVIDAIVSVLFLLIAMVQIPTSQYLYGGGMMLEAVVLRVIMRKFHRVLYTKNYDSKENC